MKAKHNRRINLTEWGKDEWEMTEEYRQKVNKIITEVTDKYAGPLADEKNWLKRFMLKFRRGAEIRKEVDKLSSMKNLHAAKMF